MAAPEPAEFDEWYETIAASPRWDGLVREWLGLPETVESTGYLTGAGLAEVTGLLALGEEQTLVEVGCGRAGYGLAVIAGGGRLTGVDFSAVALSAASRAATRLGLADRARFLLGELTSTGLPDASADAVLCVDALQFAPSVVEAAVECRRLLRPGGRLVVTSWEPADAETAQQLPDRLARMDLRRDLVDAGFADVTAQARPDWHATEVAFWRHAAEVEPGDDLALADLRAEGQECLPLADALQRVLVVARADGAD